MKLPVPGVATAACTANSLCNHSFAFLFSFFFWFYLTDLLKKQRGNTNDMFNTDQLMALQHPKEHKYHIITSPRRRLRTKAQRTSLRHGAVSQGLHRSLLPARPYTKATSLGRLPSVARVLRRGLHNRLLMATTDSAWWTWGLFYYFLSSCLGSVKALWAGACSAADKLHSSSTLVGYDVKMAIPSKWLGNHFLRGFKLHAGSADCRKSSALGLSIGCPPPRFFGHRSRSGRRLTRGTQAKSVRLHAS